MGSLSFGSITIALHLLMISAAASAYEDPDAAGLQHRNPPVSRDVPRFTPLCPRLEGRLADPVVTVLVAIPLLAIDKIGTELQSPFATDHLNHLPLDDICATIEGDLLALLGQEETGRPRDFATAREGSVATAWKPPGEPPPDSNSNIRRFITVIRWNCRDLTAVLQDSASAASISPQSIGDTSAAPTCTTRARPSPREHPRTRATAAPATAGVRLMPALQETSIGTPPRSRCATVSTAVRNTLVELPPPSISGNRQYTSSRLSDAGGSSRTGRPPRQYPPRATRGGRGHHRRDRATADIL